MEPSNKYSADRNIQAWSKEALLASEFRKHGYTIIMPPVCVAKNKIAQYCHEFREQYDFIAMKGSKIWKVMAKTATLLDDLFHDNPVECLQNMNLDDYDYKDAWGDRGERCLPIDPVWSKKFKWACSKDQIPEWYGERLWAVSDTGVNTTFFFKGSDVIETNLVRQYYSQDWNFMPVTSKTTVWSSSYVPKLERPYPQDLTGKIFWG